MQPRENPNVMILSSKWKVPKFVGGEKRELKAEISKLARAQPVLVSVYGQISQSVSGDEPVWQEEESYEQGPVSAGMSQ